MELTKFPINLGEVSDENYERAEVAALPGLLEGCQLFFDVGSNRGLYTYYANQILRDATIYCFEADPRNFEFLSKHCSTWAATGSNRIIPINAIVTDRAGTQPFLVSNENTVGSMFGTPALAAHGCTEKIDIQCVCLDQYYESDRHSVVKMDIEGGEYRALLGARRILEAQDTSFFMEIHWWGDPELKKTPSDVAAIFFQHGFATSLIGSHWYFSKRGTLRCWLSTMWYWPRFALHLQGRQLIKKKLRGLVPGRKL